MWKFGRQVVFGDGGLEIADHFKRKPQALANPDMGSQVFLGRVGVSEEFHDPVRLLRGELECSERNQGIRMIEFGISPSTEMPGEKGSRKESGFHFSLEIDRTAEFGLRLWIPANHAQYVRDPGGYLGRLRLSGSLLTSAWLIFARSWYKDGSAQVDTALDKASAFVSSPTSVWVKWLGQRIRLTKLPFQP